MTALAGWRPVFALAIRRDRWWLPLWALGIAAWEALMAASIVGLYPDDASRAGVALTIDNPGSTFLIGERYGEIYSPGILVGHQTLLFVAVAVSLLAMLTLVRHSRAEEDNGLAELVRAGRVGRLTPITVAITMALLTTVTASAAVGLGLMLLQIDGATGPWSFAWAVAAVGVCFAGVAAVAAQVARSARGANGITAAVLGGCYLLRGMGDVQGFSLPTPFGWAQQAEPWLTNAWAPPLWAVALGGVLMVFGAWLFTRRDLGAGMLPEKAGRDRAARSSISALGLAARLSRTHILGWSIAMAIFGTVYGPVLSEADQFLTQMPQLEDMIPDGAAAGGVRLFASIIVGLAALLATIPALQSITRMVGDEHRGRAAMLLSTIPRIRWLLANTVVALLAGALPLLAFGVSFGATGAGSQTDAALFGDVVLASAGYLPALAAAVGLACLLAGWAPRAVALTWAVPIHGATVFFFAELLDWPRWISWPAAFDHVAARPALSDDTVALVILTAIGAGLVATGSFGYRRRAIV